MIPQPIASRRHLTIVLVIAGIVALAGRQQASTLAHTQLASRVVPYLMAMALQLAWVRYVHIGLRRFGRVVGDFFRGDASRRGLTLDVVVLITGFVLARVVAVGVRVWLSGPAPNTAFLIPHGVLESVLWVALSLTAGVCEEIVFRGYLQQQFAALTGSIAAGVALQAAVFGVSHGYQGPVSIATTAAYGLVLGLIGWQRGNIRACAAIHAATDIVGGLLRT